MDTTTNPTATSSDPSGIIASGLSWLDNLELAFSPAALVSAATVSGYENYQETGTVVPQSVTDNIDSTISQVGTTVSNAVSAALPSSTSLLSGLGLVLAIGIVALLVLGKAEAL